VFREGFDEYIKGNWKKAKESFEHALQVRGAIDYPSKNLLAILAETNYVAPKDWEGYRVLTEK
jgi:hypothetical protein